jgi:hypothetical protein
MFKFDSRHLRWARSFSLGNNSSAFRLAERRLLLKTTGANDA